MDISIIPGATIAVVRMKIKTYVNYEYTQWELHYSTNPQFNNDNVIELNCESEGIYGGDGCPLFYDLTGLTQETTYYIKLVVTYSGDNMMGTTVVKSFDTVKEGNFEFNGSEYNGIRDGNQEQFEDLLEWFKGCMKAVGYDAKLTNSITPSRYDEYFSPVVTTYNSSSFGGQSSYGSTIQISTVDRGTLVHEYRHFLGLSSSAVMLGYHGDATSPPLLRDYGQLFPDRYPYYQTIKNVYSFYLGADENNEGEEEIYIFYGENSLPDTSYYLDFMILKALGLNDINIVY